MSRRSLFARAIGWLEDVAAGGKLDAEPKGAGKPWPPAPSRPREEPADPARVAAWRSLLDVAERLKHFEGCAASKVEGQRCHTADMRWCGREIARCMRAVWTESDRRGINSAAWAEVRERLQAALADEAVRIEVGGHAWTMQRTAVADVFAMPADTTVGEVRLALRRGGVAINGAPVVVLEVGPMDVRAGVASWALRWKPEEGREPYASLAFSEAAKRHGDALAQTEADRLRAKEAADHAAWLRENAWYVVLPEHPAVALLREIEWLGSTEGYRPGNSACVVCAEMQPHHADDCALAAILSGSKPGERALADLLAEARELGRQEQREQHARNLRALEAESQQVLGARLAEERAKGAAEEREACAKVAESPLQVGATSFRPKTPQEIAILIRARGKS